MIVVGGLDLGEADRLVRFLGAADGRVAGVARGARASKKRFAGMLDPGTRALVTLRKGKGSLPTITGTDLIRAPDRARRELERIAMLAYGCEVCAALAPEHHPAPKLTRLLEVWLDLLEGETRPGIAACQALEAKALTFAGLAPVLDRCAHCGEGLQADNTFSADLGGAVHPWCGAGKALPALEAVRLETLRRTPLAEIVNNELPGATGSVRWMLSDFIAWHLGHPLRSRSLLEEVL